MEIVANLTNLAAGENQKQLLRTLFEEVGLVMF